MLAYPRHVFATAAKIPDSVSGRISASRRSLGRNANAMASASGAALTNKPAIAARPSCLMTLTLTSHGAAVPVRYEHERSRTFAVTPVTRGAATRSCGMDRESELELVGRLRAGDTAAFDAVHAVFNGRLFGFLARLTRRRDIAEDLLEETWLRFVAHARRLEEDTRLGPWLFTVARNLHVSYCRSRALDDRRTADAIGLWPTALVDSPFEHAAGNELHRRIEAALASLPVAFREVLLLVGVEGLRPSEAALVCGVSAEALRQRLRRARVLLAERLGDAADHAFEARP